MSLSQTTDTDDTGEANVSLKHGVRVRVPPSVLRIGLWWFGLRPRHYRDVSDDHLIPVLSHNIIALDIVR